MPDQGTSDGATAAGFDPSRQVFALRMDGDGMTRDEILCRDAVLAALDRIVEAELGKKWTLERHIKRKHELLEIVDEEVTA